MRELAALVRLGNRRDAQYEPVRLGDEEFWGRLRELPACQVRRVVARAHRWDAELTEAGEW